MLDDSTLELIYSSDSITRAMAPIMELPLIRTLRTQIKENPSMVIATFEEIRRFRYVFSYVDLIMTLIEIQSLVLLMFGFP